MYTVFCAYTRQTSRDAAIYYDNWDSGANIVRDIEAAHKHDPNEHFVIVGHSWGGMTAIQVARTLRPGITIELLVLADASDRFRTGNNRNIPANVMRVFNRYQTGGGFPGAPVIHGNKDEVNWTGLPFTDPATRRDTADEISHTNIDDDLDFQQQALNAINAHDSDR